MKTSFVSNLAVQNAMRLTIQQGQLEMMKLQQEMTTGVHADSGKALGSTTSRSVSLKAEVDRLNNLKETNSIVTQRLAASQAALTTMREAAQLVRTQLLAVTGSDDSQNMTTTATTVKTQLAAFTSAANTQFNSEYVLAGINTDVKPLTDYAAASPAKAAFDTALANFSAANGGVTLPNFTAAQMTDFIKNTLEPMFMGSAWQGAWSQASDQNIQSRISPNETIATTTNTNGEGVRKFMLGAVISSELITTNVSSAARAVARSEAMEYMQQSSDALITASGTLGVSEARVKKANTGIENQVKIINTHILSVDGVDPTETSSRLTALKTQIEISYTLTARIQELSLINYL